MNELKQSFFDDLKALIVEGEFTSRWALIETYHEVGKRIRAEYGDEISNKSVQRVALGVGKSNRIIRYAIKMYDKYPQLDMIPGGKGVSFRKLIKEYLTDKQKIEDKTVDDPISIIRSKLESVISNREEVQRAVGLLTSEFAKQERAITIDKMRIATLEKENIELKKENAELKKQIAEKPKKKKKGTNVGVDTKPLTDYWNNLNMEKFGHKMYEGLNKDGVTMGSWKNESKLGIVQKLAQIIGIETFKKILDYMYKTPKYQSKTEPEFIRFCYQGILKDMKTKPETLREKRIRTGQLKISNYKNRIVESDGKVEIKDDLI